MAGERTGYVPKEIKGAAESVTRLPKKAVLFAAEKSVFVTVPLGIAAIATGAVSLGLGATLVGVDVISSHWAGKKRREMK
jgi:hypothetical protein